MLQSAEAPGTGRAGMAEVQQLLARAEQGDVSVLDQLKAFLDEHPEIWQQTGDVAKHAELALLNLAAGHNLLVKESITRKLAQLRQELAASSPLEQLLVSQIALNWLRLHHGELDAVAAQLGNNGTGLRAVHAQRRLSQAQNRYLQSLRALATIRKLLKPALSPIDLARRPVEETSGPAPAVWCGRQPRQEAVPVAN